MNTFKDWFNANLLESAEDIANHGADGGFNGIIYITECAELFDKYQEEIWDMAVEMANDLGHKNVCEMIATFKRSDMLEDIHTFKNLMVWFAVEELARQYVDSQEPA